jgi:hypothetical protein
MIFVVSLAVAFILLGGGDWLKTAGKWIGGMGNKAEDVKQTIEQKAKDVEKKVEKSIEAVKPGEKK